MTDKQIKLDGSWIPIEEAIKAGLISEKDIDIPSKRLDRIDKMEIDLANYEQMELDIEKIIEPYQLNWELDCLSLPSAIQSILERKEQECEAYKMEADEGKEINAELKAENDELKKNYFTVIQQRNKAEKILTEIKEIAERGFKHSQCNCGAKTDLDLILQKISEVLE